MPKQLIFSSDARTAILRGVDKLAEAVKVGARYVEVELGFDLFDDFIQRDA